MVSRVMVAFALLLALVAPSVAQGKHPEGRISATFYRAQGSAAASSDNVVGPFKADLEAPIHIAADKLVEVSDGAKQAVFGGKVALRQGDFLLRTTSLTAFYLGQSGFSISDEWRAEQLTRVEARERVLVISKDGRTTATGDWATFDVMAYTVLMGDHVVVARQRRGRRPEAQDRSGHRQVPLRDRERAGVAATARRANTAAVNTIGNPASAGTDRAG